MSSAGERSSSYDEYQVTADWLLARVQRRPAVAIVCGSGLGPLAELLQKRLVFQYEDVPNFPRSTVQGHEGQLVFGEIGGTQCVCMNGRFHLYEGHSATQVTFPIRVFFLLGVKTLIITNAAGGLNPKFNVGDIMVIQDHINVPGFAGQSPLRGPNDPQFGQRFPCMSDAYDRDLWLLVRETAEELHCSSFLQQGVYCMVGGPAYETVAESRLLRALGADAVGMSTVPEVVVARHCGLRVLGLSLITNMVVVDYSSGACATHEEVLDTTRWRTQELQRLVCSLLAKL